MPRREPSAGASWALLPPDQRRACLRPLQRPSSFASVPAYPQLRARAQSPNLLHPSPLCSAGLCSQERPPHRQLRVAVWQQQERRHQRGLETGGCRLAHLPPAWPAGPRKKFALQPPNRPACARHQLQTIKRPTKAPPTLLPPGTLPPARRLPPRCPTAPSSLCGPLAPECSTRGTTRCPGGLVERLARLLAQGID